LELRPKSVLIVDENCGFLTASAEFFTTEIGINLVSWANSSQEAVYKFYKYNPELVILDIGMNSLKGQELTGWFKNQANSPIVMITSVYDNEEYRNFAKSLGADGFMKKTNYRAAYPELIQYLNKNFKKICRENNYLLN
jgi:DNA-binding NarL/FixJ family response regulator